MNSQELKKRRRQRRKQHIRKIFISNPGKLRLTVFRSINHIYAQIIDDDKRVTIVSASTLDKDVLESIKPEMKKIEKCKAVGTFLAKHALEKNITTVTFDRNGYLYHGRVKALADAAREAGLKF